MSDVLLTTHEVENNPALREKLLSRWLNPTPCTVQCTGTSDKNTGGLQERFDR